jgi:tetratricopeptide (TPR) repeat protein
MTDLTICYFTLGDVQTAYKLAQMAFEKDSNDLTTVMNLGLCMKDLGDDVGAYRTFKLAYEELDSGNKYVALAYAESLLLKGDWLKAWPIYDWCRETKEEAAVNIGIPERVNEWDGKSEVELLLVIDEGGFGDSLAYSRWLPELTKRNIEWKYASFDLLTGIYGRASWCGSNIVLSQERADCSHWTTTYSLPSLLLATPLSVPLHLDPLKPSKKHADKYKATRNRLAIVGLCWMGNEERHGGRKIYSMSEGQAMRLVCRTDRFVHWVNLNESHRLPEPVLNPQINDFEDLAGLMSNLDYIVSVNTAPALLAYAMGLREKLAVVLPSNMDWKHGNGPGSTFLEGATIIRNGQGGGIERAIDKTVDHIIEKFGKRSEKSMIALVD